MGKHLPPDKKDEWLRYLAENSEEFTGADLAELLGDIARKASLPYTETDAKIPPNAYITRADIEDGLKEKIAMLAMRKREKGISEDDNALETKDEK
jgi:PIN domain nuclease of toxin-antitoxin system